MCFSQYFDKSKFERRLRGHKITPIMYSGTSLSADGVYEERPVLA